MENKTALFLNASIMRGMKELIFPSGIYEKLYLIKLLVEFSLDECNAVGAANVPAIYEAHFGVPMAGAVVNRVNNCFPFRALCS
ncbi:hypothetical protein J5N97_002064 [Dioscorea zingiberensis]|uniref:Uncharacterized protein n=1 Tax=Dioscorea zingiberensis TaxID=325984 RepID=A0A9D5BT68_9LILI|nr:hypothetical protein J5N97_002064 [Dioscorea zingiberensis]